MRSRHPREVWPIFQRDMNIQRLDRKNIFFLALFLIFGAILAWRAPRLLLAPRFWAEEGSVYFKFAYEHSFLRALFFVYWEAGYLYLLVNVVTAIAAHLLPLEYAPFATVYTALVIQLVPFLIILYGKSSVFTSIRKKITACLVFLFLPNLSHTPGECLKSQEVDIPDIFGNGRFKWCVCVFITTSFRHSSPR
jgi:hypothetical protein